MRSLLLAATFCLAALVPSIASAQETTESRDDFRTLTRQKPKPAPETTPPTTATGAAAPPTDPNAKPPEKPKIWELTPFGYLRAGYDWTAKDEHYTFVGRNNGFVLQDARLGLDGNADSWGIAFRISIEGASDELTAPNTPLGTLSVRLRDAFARWDPFPFIGVQVGQFKAPFQEEELRGTNTLMFASRAVGIEGVLPGRGFQQPGIQLDRQVGVMLSPAQPIGNSTVQASYYAMLMNGNGSNQLLDDNGKLGIVGRVELGFSHYVLLGAGVFHNDRTVGTPPNLYDEGDTGITGDVGVHVAGFQAFGGITQLHTVFPTVGTSARDQLAFNVQAGYKIDFDSWFIQPAYRFAYFQPWASGGADGFDAYKVVYQTVGIRAGLQKLPIQAWLNYTFTGEGDGRKLDNDRIEFIGQVSY